MTYAVVAGREPYRNSLVRGRFVDWSDSPLYPGSDKFLTLDEAIQAATQAAAKRVDDVHVIQLPIRPLPDNSGWDWDIVHTVSGTLSV